MFINVDKIKGDTCLFCPKPIKMDTSTRTYEESGTSDHYYDYCHNYLSVTHTPKEQIFCFDVALVPESKEKSLNKAQYNTVVRQFIELEYQRLATIHESKMSAVRERFKGKIRIEDILRGSKDCENAVIDAIVSTLSQRFSPSKDQMLTFVSELLFEKQPFGRSEFSQEALELLKGYPGHRLREGTNPYGLKCHLDCWPYTRHEAVNTTYGALYDYICKQHIAGTIRQYPRLMQGLRRMDILISPKEKD